MILLLRNRDDLHYLYGCSVYLRTEEYTYFQKKFSETGGRVKRQNVKNFIIFHRKETQDLIILDLWYFTEEIVKVKRTDDFISFEEFLYFQHERERRGGKTEWSFPVLFLLEKRFL